MSLRARLKRLEKLCQQPESDNRRALAWLAEHHPDVYERIGRFWNDQFCDVDSMFRSLSDDDRDAVADALDPVRRALKCRWEDATGQMASLLNAAEHTAVSVFLKGEFRLWVGFDP